MSVNQQAQSYVKLAEVQVKIIENVKKDKKKLISILIQKTDAKTCLRNIRQFLLESQVEPEVHEPNINLSSVFSKIPELSLNQLEYFNTTMRQTVEPALTHTKLRNDVAEIIRSDKLTDEEKVDKITDLLL